MVKPEDVLTYWLDEVGPEGWYQGGAELDAEITEKFGPAWEELSEGSYGLWLTYASGTLAYVILADQLPRNMHRGSGKAFSTDRIALSAAKMAIDRGWDMRIDEPARQFFYMPLMHSENLCDQERAMRLFLTRMPETGEDNLLHAKAHREIIRRFGRFPFRNEALSRDTTTAERGFMEEGGYAGILRELRAAEAA